MPVTAAAVSMLRASFEETLHLGKKSAAAFRTGSFKQRDLPIEFFVLDCVGNCQSLIPPELLSFSHAKRGLSELLDLFGLFAAKSSPHSLVQGFVKRDAA